MKQIEFTELLKIVQSHLSQKYSAALTDKDKFNQVKPYITTYLRENGFAVQGVTLSELVDSLYSEMVEYSFLTPYLTRNDVEEINVNGWDDVAVTFTDGTVKKVRHFHSPQHSIDIIKRLLHHSGMIIDDSMPMAQGHLPNNTRITALMTPVVDQNRGMSASIRLLHPARVSRTELIRGGSATSKMFDFLCMLLRYGVSFVVAGATSSGKTTLLNAIVGSIPDDKRIFTIESGARELALIHRDESGNVVNNVVHTLSRPSDSDRSNITQEDLVIASLRFNPDVVVIGEMRDVEAHSAVEAALTGHTVVSTIHAFAADAAHTRLALLCQKRFPIDFNLSLMQAAQAFPVVVYEHKLENNSRKIMDIAECVVDMKGNREYRTLFRYVITKNEIINGEYHIEGHFEQPEIMSEHLKVKLMNSGVPQQILERFLIKSPEY